MKYLLALALLGLAASVGLALDCLQENMFSPAAYQTAFDLPAHRWADTPEQASQAAAEFDAAWDMAGLEVWQAARRQRGKTCRVRVEMTQ